MTYVRFTKDFSVKISELSTLDFPADWSGEVDADVADKAIKAKAAVPLSGEAPTDSAKKK